jgi:alpha/beta superfamily hydrolase
MSAVTRPAEPLEATRRDAATGTTERIGFRGPPGHRLFSCLYLPTSTPRGCVLICPPLHAEFTRNYRREVLLARKLAADGFAVERFHYRGTGNSDGTGSDITFGTMREDALTSLEHLRTESGGDHTFLVGARWGALVASAAASLVPEAPLVLWEPFLESARFFRDAFRTRMVAELKSGVDVPTRGDELIHRLEAGEIVDVIGHTIEPDLYVSSVGRTIVQELGPSPRAILLLQIGPSTTIRPDLASQIDRWRAAAFDIEILAVEADEAWWLVDERTHDEGARPMTNQLIEATATWIASTGVKLPGRGAS